jgi:hypothetical protein
MIFVKVGRNRYRVQRNENDCAHHGTIEKQEYVSIDMATGKRVKKVFWTAHGVGGGWRQANKTRYKTRDEAGRALLKDKDVPYSERRMAWKEKQGESAALKEAKNGNSGNRA